MINKILPLNQDQIDFYKANCYLKIKQVFDAPTINHFSGVIAKKVAELNQETRALQARDTYGKAFLQLTNLWKEDEEIKSFVFGKRLASIATQLMEVDGVRLYHDQALFKEPGGGITPWHADQYYWPLASDKTITAWIPLQATPLEMGPLEFSAGSHRIREGRQLKISDESELKIQERLRISDFSQVIEPFDIGEVSFHSGWVFHRAGANATGQMRRVMTVIFMDQDMRLKEPENDGQRNDWKDWCPGVEIGAVVNSPLNPILYSRP